MDRESYNGNIKRAGSSRDKEENVMFDDEFFDCDYEANEWDEEDSWDEEDNEVTQKRYELFLQGAHKFLDNI